MNKNYLRVDFVSKYIHLGSCLGDSSLEVRVHLDVHMEFSFGLEMIATASMSLVIYVGAFMKNLLATVVACVWCGMALLRSTGVKLQSKRGTVVTCSLKYLSKSRLGGSIPLLRTIH